YDRLELIIVNNKSTKQDTFALFCELKKDTRVKILEYPLPFNFSAINNTAARHAKGDVLLFLNNDIEVIEAGWLQEMVSEVMRANVGAVGAKLLYPDGRIQHAGVVLGLKGVAGHAFHLLNNDDNGYFGHAVLKRNVSAVTGACLAMRRSVFEEVGGFEEKHLRVAFNDVDLCLNVLSRGYEIIWTPFATLIHHESASRGYEDTPEKQARLANESEYMRQKWGELISHDPFYNRNFSLRHGWGYLPRLHQRLVAH
ncbi:MAG: glycosyltransferase, partial [Rhodospirillales bacterium]|nr:glycosyltransferase [Rhodospirillales bacterium]